MTTFLIRVLRVFALTWFVLGLLAAGVTLGVRGAEGLARFGTGGGSGGPLTYVFPVASDFQAASLPLLLSGLLFTGCEIALHLHRHRSESE